MGSVLILLLILYLIGCLFWLARNAPKYAFYKEHGYPKEDIKESARKTILTPIWVIPLSINAYRFVRALVKDAI